MRSSRLIPKPVDSRHGEADGLLSSPSRESLDSHADIDEAFPTETSFIPPQDAETQDTDLQLDGLYKLFNAKRALAQHHTRQYLEWLAKVNLDPDSLTPVSQDYSEAKRRMIITRDKATWYLHAMETIIAFLRGLREAHLDDTNRPNNVVYVVAPSAAAWTIAWTVVGATFKTTLVTGIAIFCAVIGIITLALTARSAWHSCQRYRRDRDFDSIWKLTHRIRKTFEDDIRAIDDRTVESLDESNFASLEGEIEKLAELTAGEH